ncbi:MAG TPA: IclR family transcriptional regulator [Micromonosporaceae bacterium]|jgi:DNA-binding IclR family transcriptional regulator
MSAESVPAVKSALRTVEVLELIARERTSLSLADVHQRLGYPKSSLSMLLRTLVEAGWLETDASGGRYGIGLHALLAGTSYLDGDRVVAAARDVMMWLSETTGETVHLARLDGDDIVYLATRESQHYLRPISRVGRRLPAYATSLGKALLAERGPAVPGELTAITPYTLIDPSVLAADLAATRARGYAVDHEENVLGLRCFGAAVRAHEPVRDAISCSVPLARLTPGRDEEIVVALLTARDRLESALVR